MTDAEKLKSPAETGPASGEVLDGDHNESPTRTHLNAENYVSARVFDGIRPISPSHLNALRGAYRLQVLKEEHARYKAALEKISELVQDRASYKMREIARLALKEDADLRGKIFEPR